MNPIMKRLFAVMLALLMLAGTAAGMVSCKNTGGDDTTAESTTETPETDAPQPTSIKLVDKGVCQATVVRSDNLAAADTPVQQAMKIRTNLNKYVAKGDTKIDTDWTKDGTHDPEKIEILVGMTNYEETQEAIKDVSYGDYVIKAVGNKIVIYGYTSDALTYASTIFNSMLADAAKKNDDDTYDLELDLAALNVTGTRSSLISKIPHYSGGTFYSYYDPGDDAEEIILKKTNADEFRKYMTDLSAAGYTLHASHEIKDNIFGTFYNDSYIINAGFYAYESAARIIIEPYRAEVLPVRAEDNKWTEVTTSQITMIGLEYKKDDGGYASNGLSILIRLCDGRFIVVDGGFNRANCINMLVNQMKTQSSAYSSKTGGIKVAAWIITHAHGDHNGAINGKYSTVASNNIKVERFFVNFMSDVERNKSIANTGNFSSGEGGNWTTTYVAAAALKADVVPVHVGQVYYLADLKLEVLYTIESYGPEMTNALNTTSLIMKMTFKDPKTGKETVYMSTGDATGPGFNISSKMYGDYLKSDIVQVAHHGYTTWGTETGTITAYRLMAPSTVAWPQGIKAYPNYKDKSYNKAIWDTSSNPNYQETLVAGWEGSITTFPLPYTPGSAIVNAVNPPD